MAYKSEIAQTEFNMDQASLIRLNGGLVLCDEYSFSRDVNNWYYALGVLYRELSNACDKEDSDYLSDEWVSIKPLLDKYLNNKNRNPVAPVDHKLFMALHNYDRKLRRILQEKGLEKRMKPTKIKGLR